MGPEQGMVSLQDLALVQVLEFVPVQEPEPEQELTND